jgi:hypothetical protein
MGAYVAPRARSKVGLIIKKYKSMMLNFELLIKKNSNTHEKLDQRVQYF